MGEEQYILGGETPTGKHRSVSKGAGIVHMQSHYHSHVYRWSEDNPLGSDC
jgi:hypothetical protein